MKRKVFLGQHGFSPESIPCRCIFIHLNNCFISVQLNHFAHQTFFADHYRHTLLRSCRLRLQLDRIFCKLLLHCSFYFPPYGLEFYFHRSTLCLAYCVSQCGVFLRSNAKHCRRDGCESWCKRRSAIAQDYWSQTQQSQRSLN